MSGCCSSQFAENHLEDFNHFQSEFSLLEGVNYWVDRHRRLSEEQSDRSRSGVEGGGDAELTQNRQSGIRGPAEEESKNDHQGEFGKLNFSAAQTPRDRPVGNLHSNRGS